MLKIVFTSAFIFSAWSVAAQVPDSSPNNKALMLLSSAFITVSREAAIDLDSSLVLTAKYHHLSRAVLISEGIDDAYAIKCCRWIDDRNTSVPENEIKQLHGSRKVRLQMLLGAYYAFQPGFRKSDTKRGIYWLRLAEKGNNVVNNHNWGMHINCLLGKCYLKSGAIGRAKECFRKVTASPYFTDQRIVAKAWNYEGMYTPFLPSTSGMRIIFLTRACKLFFRVRDEGNRANALANIAYLNFARQNFRDAEMAAMESLRVQRYAGIPYSHYTTDLLSLIAQMKGNYVGHLRWALESIRSANFSGDHMELALFYARVGDAYATSSDKRGNAVVWYKKALSEFLKNKDGRHAYKLLIRFYNEDLSSSESNPLIGLINRLLIASPPENTIDQQDAYIALGEAYRRMKDYKKAEKYFLEARGLSAANQRIRGKMNDGNLNFLLGQFYFQAGNLPKSRRYLTALVRDSAASREAAGNLAEAYWLLHQIDAGLGKYVSSMHYLQLHNQLADSIHHITDQPGYAAIFKLPMSRPVVPVNSASAASGSARINVTVLVLIALTLIGFGWVLISRFKVSIRKLLDNQYQKRLLAEATRKQIGLLASREKLLKEVQFRVQDNLKIIISLLSRQSDFITDQDALEAIGQSQSRMMAMSLVYGLVEPENEHTGVNLAAYVSTLVAFLQENHQKAKYIRFVLNLDPVHVDLSKAVPLALMVHEILTNSIRHAFLFQEYPEINIELQLLPGEPVRLFIQDNGSGLPDDLDPVTSRSFGFSLIVGLASQIDALPVFRSHMGLAVEISFALQEEKNLG
ncbi:histidine kinase dimerization/phosphoacceptor domain -containing protein [Mucilaginibacter celer]|nr:histidine kinase dimerization/phosphoacceptor domain -containing protein [Mucilaginibacter celer]